MNSVSKGTNWTDGNRIITVTAVEGDLVEYGYPGHSNVFYLSMGNFRSSFRREADKDSFTINHKKLLTDRLKVCLKEIKDKGLGDEVYYMMHELGL